MAGERLKQALRTYRRRYLKADRKRRSGLLDEFCVMTGYHRKYAITLLNRADDDAGDKPPRRRGPTYSRQALRVIERVWKAAGYPWAERLKAMLPTWAPWLGPIPPDVLREAFSISARQIDRRLASKKRRIKRRLYGRTKPGTLLRREIPVKTHSWDVAEPGSAEVDLVSHSGPSASGEFAWSLNVTDVHLGWCETRAVLGRGQEGVVAALDGIRRSLPFALRAIDSDNGSEFINHHLLAYCRRRAIQFTRGRPYKKDDNAHVEQKNWTHVRRIFGWERYDSPEVVAAMNELYEGDLRLMMNLFQASVKLAERRRVGSRLTRRYEAARTPLDRLADHYSGKALPDEAQALLALREGLNPFELAQRIERRLDAIERVRSRRPEPRRRAAARRPAPLLPPPGGRAALETAHAR